ncbi:MAG: hypothetical protein NUV77_19615 [Thermoguttaceae bacterium]|jgi:hypothetical protein|nr:hypothetical protein [Thermoguttaceae bacterium]
MTCGAIWTGCKDSCWECTGQNPGDEVPRCLRVAIAGVVSYGGYGYGGTCCLRLNGTYDLPNYHRLQPGERWLGKGDSTWHGCVWWGPLPRPACDTCPQYWLSVVFHSEYPASPSCEPDPNTQNCRVTLYVTKVEPYASLTQSPSWLLWTDCVAISGVPCWCPTSLCDRLRATGGLSLPLAEGVCGQPTPDGYVCWMLEDAESGYYGYAGCCWDLRTAQLNLSLPDCCKPPAIPGCCCEGARPGQEPRTIAVTLSGVGPSGCQCHNGWPWVVRLLWPECGTGEKSVACQPSPLGSPSVSLVVDKANRKARFTYGDPVFEGPWDGTCAGLDGLQLPYVRGDTHGCDVEGAVATLHTSPTDPPEVLVGGDSASKGFIGGQPYYCPVCFECPRPEHMYLTLAGLSNAAPLADSACGVNVTLDWSTLNGTWALSPWPGGWPVAAVCSAWGVTLDASVAITITVPGGVVARWQSGTLTVEFTACGSGDDPCARSVILKLEGTLLAGSNTWTLRVWQRRRLAPPGNFDEPYVQCFGEIVTGEGFLTGPDPEYGCPNEATVWCDVLHSTSLVSPAGSWSVEGDH